jgi:peptidoglycan-associated lipoprotein
MPNLRLAAAVAVLALLGACSNDSNQDAANAGTGGAGSGAGTVRPGSQEDLVANVGDRVFFAFDSSVVAADQRPTLQRQAQWLQQYPQNQITVAGNTDERGTREYNLALGQRRANAARDILVASGVAGSRIETISYGKDRPTALGSDEAAWAQNRNATTTVR